jgi:hypothetical protein
MTTIATSPGPTYPAQAAGTQAALASTDTQAATAAGAATLITSTLPPEIGSPGARAAVGGKPTLPEPRRTAGPHRFELPQLKKTDSARGQADANLDRADLLREIRKERREAVCAEAFEPQDFARLVVGPLSYCMKHPVSVVVCAVAVGSATALALSTGSLAGFKTAMPMISPLIAGMVGSSGVDEMLQRGAELALLKLGVDPRVTEKWGDAAGSAVYVGANVAMNALGGTWSQIDMDRIGDLATDVAVVLNVPEQNAEALGTIVSMVGSGAVAIGFHITTDATDPDALLKIGKKFRVGVDTETFTGLTAANLQAVKDEVKKQLTDGTLELTDITSMAEFKAMQKSWASLVETFGGLQDYAAQLSALASPGAANSSFKA